MKKIYFEWVLEILVLLLYTYIEKIMYEQMMSYSERSTDLYRLNVVVEDADVFVSIITIMLIPKTKNMSEFME